MAKGLGPAESLRNALQKHGWFLDTDHPGHVQHAELRLVPTRATMIGQGHDRIIRDLGPLDMETAALALALQPFQASVGGRGQVVCGRLAGPLVGPEHQVGAVGDVVDVDLEVPGCPPRPEEIIAALRSVTER